MYKILIIAVLCFISGRLGAQNVDGQPDVPTTAAVGESSQEVLKIQLGAIYDSIKKKTIEEGQINTILDTVKKAQKTLAVSETVDLTSDLTRARESFKELKKAWIQNSNTAIASALREFTFNMNRVARKAYGQTDRVLDELEQIASPDIGFSRDAPRATMPEYIINIVRGIRPKFDYDSWQIPAPSLNLLRDASYRGIIRMGDGKSDQLDPDKLSTGSSPLPIDAAELELNDSIITAFERSANAYRESSLQSLNNAEVAIVNLLDKLKKAIAADNSEAKTLDLKLKKKEDTIAGRANKVSGNLLTIFIGIMVTILATLIILRVKGDDLSFLMIRERTAVEMLSIGMFLVTVLFLGAGDFIEKSTLGTLLGTLGGYLFTRRASQSTGSLSTRQDEGPLIKPAAPGQPTFDAATRKLKISSTPADADYLTVTAREVATLTSTFLGVISGNEFDLASTVLSKGTYELRLIAYNSAGASPPSKAAIATIG